ncbi:hypothetical protein [Tsukamurella sp. USMM236]|uniref:hypothetical protein n=1 Tax=Tsukamurella sp. USMM236 TaxID=3081301 RepID=UPI0030198D07
MNRRQRRAQLRGPLPLAEFSAELRKAVAGDPSGDLSIKQFWDEFSAERGIAAALPTEGGLEVLYRDR